MLRGLAKPFDRQSVILRHTFPIFIRAAQFELRLGVGGFSAFEQF
jgi:hypothetical protein